MLIYSLVTTATSVLLLRVFFIFLFYFFNLQCEILLVQCVRHRFKPLRSSYAVALHLTHEGVELLIESYGRRHRPFISLLFEAVLEV